MEFKLLGKIKYKEKRFMMLSSKKHQKYFLRILEDKSLIYPTLEELGELYKLFKLNPDENEILFKLNSQRTKEGTNEPKKFQIIPKVINKGALIPLASALVLLGTGCSLSNDINEEKEFSFEGGYTQQKNEKEMSESQNKETIKVQPEPKVKVDKRILENCKYQFELEEMPEDILVYYSYVKNDKQIKKCRSMDEFREYVDIKNPTYDDVRNALENNEKVPDNYKLVLKRGLDNLEKDLPNLDLVVLYYNINRLQIEERDTSNDKELGELGPVLGYFNPQDGKVVIDNTEEIDELTILHEILGHGLTEAHIDDSISYSMKLNVVTLNNEAKCSLSSLGYGLEEGKAETIAVIANGKGYKYASGYTEQMEELRIFMETSNTSMEDLVKYGISELIWNMNENDVNLPLTYIDNVDTLLLAQAYDGVFDELEDEAKIINNVTNYFVDYADDKLKKGIDKEEIIEKVNNVMENSKFDLVSAPKGGISLADSERIEDLTNHVIETLNNFELDEKEQGVDSNMDDYLGR